MKTPGAELQYVTPSPLSKTTCFKLAVMFGDCDPAGIVFFPNFLKWMDASSHHFFTSCGVPPFRELERTRGIVGHPLLEVQTRFFQPATYGDHLEVITSVVQWREKVFLHTHEVRKGSVLLCEGTETRTFVVRHPTDPQKIKSIPVPEDIKAMCSQG